MTARRAGHGADGEVPGPGDYELQAGPGREVSEEESSGSLPTGGWFHGGSRAGMYINIYIYIFIDI